MELYIKNMVCLRCKLAVKNILQELEIEYTKVELGNITLKNELTSDKLALVGVLLEEIGLELVNRKVNRVVNKVTTLLVELVQSVNISRDFSFSVYISEKVSKNYVYVAYLFSKQENITLEQYFLLLKIEKVKELLIDGEYNLTIISKKMGYSSVSHLSAHFKRATGLTPKAFKANSTGLRKELDKLIETK